MGNEMIMENPKASNSVLYMGNVMRSTKNG